MDDHDHPRATSVRLEQFQELLDVQSSLLENVGKCRALHGAMSRNRQLQHLVADSLLEPQVASPLTDNHPSIRPSATPVRSPCTRGWEPSSQHEFLDEAVL